MANRLEHEIIGALAGSTCASFKKGDAGAKKAYALTGALVGKYAARLPDILEPALHPNHRNFFHSWFLLGALGAGAHKLWKWETETKGEELLKWVLLIAAAGYASHLLRDSLTPKGLPLV